MQAWIDTASFIAHGYCLLWQPWLVALYAGSDLLIFAAYSLIPFALIRFLRQRPDLRYRGLVALFAAFILLCGITHLISILTLWFPAYPLHGFVKLLTGIVSMTTAVVLFRLIPKLVTIPSPMQLEAANAKLRSEIAAHEATLARLREAQRDLEAKVAARTADLKDANARLSIVTRETVHRANNLLTVVSSIARQTASAAPDLATFLDRFTGRLSALADATAEVIRSDGQASADLGTVARSQLQPMLEAFPGRVAIEGPPTELPTEAAQQLALAIHELATNSVKHGALAHPEGRVELSWRPAVAEDRPVLRLDWRERRAAGQPPVGPPDRSGFGTVLLTQAVPGTLKGRGVFEPTEYGLLYRLEAPLYEPGAPPLEVGAGGRPSAAAE